MKKLLFSLLGCLLNSLIIAQVVQPPVWTHATTKTEVKAGEEIELIFKADIPKDWYLYSSDFDPELGPMVTTFNFKPNDTYQLIGKVKPIGAKKKYDDIFEGEYTYFRNKAEFRQKVKILKPNPAIAVSYEYQICTDVDGRCVQFEGEHVFDKIVVSSVGTAASQAPADQTTKPTVTPSESPGAVKSAIDSTVNSATQPAADSANSDAAQVNADAASKANDDKGAASPIVQTSSASISTQPDGFNEMSLWTFMLLAFGSGLIALLTPCVFPMIPMTVTFFTKRSGTRAAGIRKALIYGLSIIAIYTLAGTVVARINGPEFNNWISTHWLPNVLFFSVFILFGMSFLGMFEIVLPNSWVNKVDAQSDRGGLYGVFFMAFTLVLVSFSCTGPIVGLILVQSAGGEWLKPIVGMLGFSFAFALPFTLFAIFPSWLSNLPKSGGWLNSVKVVLGFVELALAFKFLSIADQAYHWGILDREIYLAIWIVIFTLLGLYLLGKIRMPHDNELHTISVPRLMLAIVSLTFVVYLIPGMFGAPLKALSGYLPPQGTLDFNLNQASIHTMASNTQNDLCEPPKHGHLARLTPHGLQSYFDMEQALECAKKQNKPVFVDFTGHGCVNCREMEANVWADPEVLQRLREDYIIVALYVDDKKELPESEWYTSSYDNKVKKTIGKQNADLQVSKYGNNAQPYYLILSPEGELLVQPKAYDLNVQNFVDFLEAGKKAFKEKQSLPA